MLIYKDMVLVTRSADKKPRFLDKGKGNVNLAAPISFKCVSVTLYFPGCGEG